MFKLVVFYIATAYGSDQCLEEKCIDPNIFYEREIDAFKSGEQIKIKVSTVPVLDNKNGGYHYVASEAFGKFISLMQDASKNGFNLKLNSSFRDSKQQKNLIRKYGNIAARDGWSNHQSGFAVDIAGTTYISNEKHHMLCREFEGKFKCPTKLYWWLIKNSKKYGFYNTMPDEPWHFDFYPETAIARLQ